MFVALIKSLIDKSNTFDDCASDDSLYISCLYQRYKTFLFRNAAKYTTNPYAKEDIVQDTVLRLIGKSEKLRAMKPAALVTYLSLTVRSAALNYLRAEHRELLDALPLPDDDDENYFLLDVKFQTTTEEWALLNHRDEEIRAAIESLSTRDRLALAGKYYLQMDNRELAEMLGVTVETLRTLLCRARGRVLKKLGKENLNE